MTYSRIPDELRRLPQWVCWRYVEVEGSKPTKVPYSPMTDRPASVMDASTWVSFEQAVYHASRYDGIGFVFSDSDPYCGIDLDTPQDVDGKSLLSPEDGARHQLIFEQMASYSERSPSGTGLHIIVKARVPHGRKRASIEVYSSGRYFTMTGDVYNDVPIMDRQDIVDLLWGQMGAQAQANHFVGDFTEHHTDEEIYNMASRAANGDLFVRLWNGDTSGYFSASEADFALIDIIAFYTKHRMQIQRMFLLSELGKRDKYAHANPRRLSALMGYMINKSFDRVLPPVDFAGLIDEFNSAIAARRGADLDPAICAPAPQPVGVADRQSEAGQATPHPSGHDLTLWRTLAPPGVLGELVRYNLSASARPVYEISLCAALGLMSGICGRAYNVSGTGLNHYIMCLAPTGTGKEAMASTISRLMSAVAKELPSAQDFIGPAEIASGQALLKHLSNRGTPCFVSLVGEIGLRMQQMTHPQASTSDIALRRVMLDLFNKSGAGEMVRPTIYSDSKNNTDPIHSPAFSLLGDSTPETFYKALDEDAIIQGLLPRFTIVEYTGPRVESNEGHAFVQPPVPLVESIVSLARQSYETMATGHVITVRANNEAAALLREIDRDADARINTSERDVLRQLWNRVHLKTLKIAALLAVSINSYEPYIDATMVRWAHSLVLSDTYRLLERFNAGTIGTHNENSEQDDALRQALKLYLTQPYPVISVYGTNAKMHDDKVIPYAFLQRRLVGHAAFRRDKRGATQAIKQAVQTMIDSGVLQEAPLPQIREKYAFNGRSYVAVNVSWIIR